MPAVLVARLDSLEDVLRLLFDAVRKLRAEIRETYPESFPPAPLTPLAPIGQRASDVPVPYGPESLVPDRPDPSWVPIIHRMHRVPSDVYPHPPPPCNRPGLYLTQPPRDGIVADPALMRICPPGERRWRPPQVGVDTPSCQSCGAPIDPFSSYDLDYLSVMLPARPQRDEASEVPDSAGSPPSFPPDPGLDGSSPLSPAAPLFPAEAVGPRLPAVESSSAASTISPEMSSQNLAELRHLASQLFPEESGDGTR